MKTIIFGRVTEDQLADAALFSGITPTSFITNGIWTPPISQFETTVIPECPKVTGEAGVRQNHWRMVIAAEALIMTHYDEHLLSVARRYELPVHEAF